MAVKISVVIPVYNRPSLLLRALQSVGKQTFQPFEVLVVDDGSCPQVVYRGGRISSNFKLIRNEENLGVAAARNRGINSAKGEWIAFLDSDDEWAPSKLAKQAELIKSAPNTRAIHTDEKWMRNGNEVMPPKYLDKSSNLLWERSLDHCLICPSSVLLHRSLFASIGLFDETLTVCEDYDFWLRLLLKEDIGLVDEKLVIKHGGNADQLSTTIWGMDRFRVIALQRILANNDLSHERKLRVLEVLYKKCRILAQGSEKREKFEEAKNYRALAEKYSHRLGQSSALPA